VPHFPADDFRLLFVGLVLLYAWASILAIHLLSGRPGA
jgi:hypothetical protein